MHSTWHVSCHIRKACHIRKVRMRTPEWTRGAAAKRRGGCVRLRWPRRNFGGTRDRGTAPRFPARPGPRHNGAGRRAASPRAHARSRPAPAEQFTTATVLTTTTAHDNNGSRQQQLTTTTSHPLEQLRLAPLRFMKILVLARALGERLPDATNSPPPQLTTTTHHNNNSRQQLTRSSISVSRRSDALTACCFGELLL